MTFAFSGKRPNLTPSHVSKIASELKKRAKAMEGSVYVKDQRGQAVEMLSAPPDLTSQVLPLD